MKCPKCNHRLVTKSGDKVKLRVPILVFSQDGSSCVTSCPGCHEEIQIPVVLDEKAIPSDGPALVLTKARLPVRRARE